MPNSPDFYRFLNLKKNIYISNSVLKSMLTENPSDNILKAEHPKISNFTPIKKIKAYYSKNYLLSKPKFFEILLSGVQNLAFLPD